MGMRCPQIGLSGFYGGGAFVRDLCAMVGYATCPVAQLPTGAGLDPGDLGTLTTLGDPSCPTPSALPFPRITQRVLYY